MTNTQSLTEAGSFIWKLLFENENFWELQLKQGSLLFSEILHLFSLSMPQKVCADFFSLFYSVYIKKIQKTWFIYWFRKKRTTPLNFLDIFKENRREIFRGKNKPCLSSCKFSSFQTKDLVSVKQVFVWNFIMYSVVIK